MRKIQLVLVALAGISLAAFAADAQAQRGGGRGFGRGMAKVMLVGQESVQKELALTDEQKTKLEDIRAEMPQFGGGGGGGGNFAETIAKLDKDVEGVLDEKQNARLQQISYQASGILGSVAREEVAAKLELTQEQKDQFDDLRQEQREAMQDLFQGGGDDPEVRREKVAELRKEMDEKAKAKLTEGQVAKLTEMMGEPFDTSTLRFFGRGGGRGGRQ